MQKMIAEFPYQAKENGHCEKYDNGRCLVYEDRPLMCNIERAADELDLGMTKEEWFDINYQGCKLLQDEADEGTDLKIANL
jgi:Fe-S-cluster containining protein